MCANVTAHRAGLRTKSAQGTEVKFSHTLRKAPATPSTPSWEEVREGGGEGGTGVVSGRLSRGANKAPGREGGREGGREIKHLPAAPPSPEACRRPGGSKGRATTARGRRRPGICPPRTCVELGWGRRGRPRAPLGEGGREGGTGERGSCGGRQEERRRGRKGRWRER